MLTTLVFTAACATQIFYWTALNRGFRRARAVEHGIRDSAVAAPPEATVVVAARNEEDSIPTLLSSLTSQDHPRLQYVFVDDASTDATATMIVEALPDATVIRVTEPLEPRKKNALTSGISAADTDILLFTDADCTPPPKWASRLTTLLAGASDRVVVGYSPFRRLDGLLNKFARYETFVSGFLAAAAIGLRRPYTATGRNLAYGSNLFNRAGGFASIMHSLSGDDDLMLQHLATTASAEVVHAFGTDTYVETDPPTTWRDWTRQKLRHTSAGRHYRANIKSHLFAYHATSTATWLSPIFLGWIGLALIVSRQLAQFAVLRSAATTFNESDLMARQPLYELMYVVYNVLLAPLGVVRRPARW